VSRLIAMIAIFASIVLVPAISSAQGTDPDNTLLLDLKDGRVVIQLRPGLAPNHV